MRSQKSESGLWHMGRDPSQPNTQLMRGDFSSHDTFDADAFELRGQKLADGLVQHVNAQRIVANSKSEHAVKFAELNSRVIFKSGGIHDFLQHAGGP